MYQFSLLTNKLIFLLKKFARGLFDIPVVRTPHFHCRVTGSIPS